MDTINHAAEIASRLPKYHRIVRYRYRYIFRIVADLAFDAFPDLGTSFHVDADPDPHFISL
jgi:hypothetical protein